MRVWSLLLLLALLLPAAAGCAAEGSAEQPPQTKREESAASHAQGEIFASKTRDQARPLTEEEILSAYDRAVTACGWFQLSTLPCGPESQTVENQVYYRVNFRGMEDLDDLRIYLRGIFSQELAEELLATGGDRPLYREIDGKLYARPVSRAKDPRRGQSQIRVEQTGETTYDINVAVDLLDDDAVTVTGMECCTFPYELVEDRWVFTAFWLLY